MKKILSIICLLGFATTMSAQVLGGPGGGDTYRLRDHDYVWGEDDEYCIVQCVLNSILDCTYHNGNPESC